MKKLFFRILSILFLIGLLPGVIPDSYSYPIDGYAVTGIRRLLRLQYILKGQLKGKLPPPGARKSISEIHLNLLNARGDSLATFPPVNRQLQTEIDRLFARRNNSYALTLLEITPGKAVRFAQRQMNRRFSPGSVGKLAIAVGLFTELQRLFPDDPDSRRHLLRSRIVVADQWIHNDHHGIPIFDPTALSYHFRPAREGDRFTLFEWLDHMLSVSANSAASMVWKEAILMRAFGKQYPPSREAETAFFEHTSRDSLSRLAMAIVNNPLRKNGIPEQDWHLGSFFTRTGKRRIPGRGGSFASPKGLLRFLIALERGKVVDQWSSLELKRLLYLTARRIRYASAPRLRNDAVYFKSGSLYRCRPEAGFHCKKYMGNVENAMNSVAIVEKANGQIYLVVLMSNVLRKNSAVEHQSLATFIDKILSKQRK